MLFDLFFNNPSTMISVRRINVMAINVKGLEIETCKLYEEYIEEELKVLPPLNSKYKSNWRLGYDGDWYKDTTD